MKISSIPKQIERGSYECEYTLVSFIKYIEELMQGNPEYTLVPLQMNPDFQRGHVWTEEQQIKYMEVLLQNGATHSRVIYLNCPSWMTTNKDKYIDRYNDFVCVDGLQRYTAIKRFVNNEIKAYGYYLDEFEDAKIFKRKHMIRVNINNLQTKKEVLQWYLQINNGGTPHTRSEINRVEKMIKECE